MKRITLVVFVSLLGLIGAAQTALAETRYSFRAIDVPGAAGTVAGLSNATGQMVGLYSEQDPTLSRSSHGFLLQQGAFTAIDFPGTTATTDASAINAGGDIVGSYTGASGSFHGYLLSGGTFTSFDFPGSAQTQAIGINNRGQIVGPYSDSS